MPAASQGFRKQTSRGVGQSQSKAKLTTAINIMTNASLMLLAPFCLWLVSMEGLTAGVPVPSAVQ